MAEFIKIGAGWKTKKGNGYSCTIQVPVNAGDRILIFKNKNKKEDKHPDIILGYFEDEEGKQAERDQRPNEPAHISDEDIPF